MAKKYSRTVLSTVCLSNLAKHQHFATVFNLAHDTLEYFVNETGITWKAWFGEPHLVVPIINLSASYKKEMITGQDLDIEITVKRLGGTSVSMDYTFQQGGDLCCVVSLVHVFVDTETQKKTNIPEPIRNILKDFVES